MSYLKKEFREWSYELRCLLAYILGHASPPDRRDDE